MKSQEIRAAVMRNPFQGENLPSHIFSMNMYIKNLQYQEHLSALENTIDALALEIEEYKIIHSIPGIGGKIAATIISEIGEIDRFNHTKKLVDFAGVDPRVYESGRFKATINHISKRDSNGLRHTLFVAVLSKKDRQKEIKRYFTIENEAKEKHIRSQ